MRDYYHRRQRQNSAYHDRMPVIISPDDYSRWLAKLFKKLFKNLSDGYKLEHF